MCFIKNHFKSQFMKATSTLLIIFLLIFSACNKENVVEDEYLRLKNAGLDIQLDLSFSGQPDWTAPKVACTPEGLISLPGKIWISGSTELLGAFDNTKSYMLTTSCELIDVNTLKENFEGKIYTSDGDYFNAGGVVLVDISNSLSTFNAPVIGNLKVNDGIGKFEGVSGSIILSGTVDFTDATMVWNGDGLFAYK
jgi:hypothetical protein